MQAVIVMPLHDPTGLMFPLLEVVTPQLKSLFGHAFISVAPATRTARSGHVRRVEEDPFFTVVRHATDVQAGDGFLALYQQAAADCHPDQALHLCFIDRVAFALLSEYRAEFSADIQTLQDSETPLIFQRSAAAWATHPQNYSELEQIVTRTGEFLFHRSLDFAWCHLVVQAGQLQAVLPYIRHRDISMIAEIPLLLREHMHTKDVDWLAWEDPFVLNRDARELKQERERSSEETRKRLAYVIPMLRLLDEAARS